jgi:hypothetical protein
MKNTNQKGTSILLTILIMAALLAIAIGISRLSLGEIKLTRDVSKSLTAFYSADAGVEAAIFYERSVLGGSGLYTVTQYCLDSPSNNVCYTYTIEDNIAPGYDRKITSKGSYEKIERAIELAY